VHAVRAPRTARSVDTLLALRVKMNQVSMYVVDWAVSFRPLEGATVSDDGQTIAARRADGHIGLICASKTFPRHPSVGAPTQVRVVSVQAVSADAQILIGFADPLYFFSTVERELSVRWWGVTQDGCVVRQGIMEPAFKPLHPQDTVVLLMDVTRQILYVFVNKVRVATIAGVLAQVPIVFWRKRSSDSLASIRLVQPYEMNLRMRDMDWYIA
jgi:hypothetical protein